MKILNKTAFLFFFLLLALASCESEDELPQLDDVAAPSNISALFTIKADNSGLVTIQPNGQGVTAYTVHFGDGTDESADLGPGERVQRTYAEGTYTVRISAMGINGKVTEHEQELVVSFLPPENLIVSIVPVPGDPFSIDVSATADFATFFEAYFGEMIDEEPTLFMPGETVRYTYADVGEYAVRVVARSGGTAGVEFNDTVVISNPLLLPVDFESSTQNYGFGNFGGATASVVDNPDVGEGNPSARVGQLVKETGSEVWAGSFFDLGQPVDFSEFQKIGMKVWSPQAGIPIILKLENLDDANVFVEVEVQSTAAGQWEELLFDFEGQDLSNEYQRIVVFFDFGTEGDDSAYYFDDIRLTDGSAELSLPVDFESDEIVYAFESFGGASAEVIDNPDPSGSNTSGRVGSFVKQVGSETWGGVFIDMAAPINFGNRDKIRMKVWAPQADVAVLLKFESINNPGVEIEVSVQNTVANAWEELEFDFAGINSADEFQRVVLFFDFGNTGTAAPYYFDDIQLVD